MCGIRMRMCMCVTCVCAYVCVYVCVRARVYMSDLPVGTVATAAHGPGDERARDARHTRAEGDRGEATASFKGSLADAGQRMR